MARPQYGKRVHTMSIKLTDTQLVILSTAAQREDRCLVTPKSLKGGAPQKIAAKLLAAGLVKEIKAKPGMAIWRREDEAGQSFSLKLTAAGRSRLMTAAMRQPVRARQRPWRSATPRAPRLRERRRP